MSIFDKCKDFYLVRKYVQFGDLVIDNFEMLQSASLSGGYKTESQAYSFRHGSYMPFKRRHQFSREQQLSMTLKIDTFGMSRDNRQFFKDFIKMTLAEGPQRLWAVEGNELIWTWAACKDFSEEYALKKNEVSIDVELTLFEGIWHKANRFCTFLKPYEPCLWDECLAFRDPEPCQKCCPDCVSDVRYDDRTCCCTCDVLKKQNSLCNFDDFNVFYRKCKVGYQIYFDCDAGNRIWGDKYRLGGKVCKNGSCTDIIAGQYYSYTILDTEADVTLVGEYKDPKITINGNTMQITGKFQGELLIRANGDMIYTQKGCCDDCVKPDCSDKYPEDHKDDKEDEKPTCSECCPPMILLEPDDLVIPEGNTFGWTIKHGNNSVLVETGNCCSWGCIHIREDVITN